MAKIWMKKHTMSGQPVIRGTRFPIGQVIANLADGVSLPEFCEDYDLDLKLVQEALGDVSVIFSYWKEFESLDKVLEKLEELRPEKKDDQNE